MRKAMLPRAKPFLKPNVTVCHKIDSRLIGPALGPTITDETDDKWLTKWIQNNQALIAGKDAKALKIYNEYNQAGMTTFGEISDGDAANIIAYARTTWKTMQAAPKPGANRSACTGNRPKQPRYFCVDRRNLSLHLLLSWY